MQSWDIDPATRDYVMINGAPVETDSLRVPAYIRLKVRLGAWLYAPDPEYGSRLNQIKRGSSSVVIENAAAAALKPLVDDARASSISVTNDMLSRTGVGVQTEITEASGLEDTLKLNGLGV